MPLKQRKQIVLNEHNKVKNPNFAKFAVNMKLMPTFSGASIGNNCLNARAKWQILLRDQKLSKNDKHVSILCACG